MIDNITAKSITDLKNAIYKLKNNPDYDEDFTDDITGAVIPFPKPKKIDLILLFSFYGKIEIRRIKNFNLFLWSDRTNT